MPRHQLLCRISWLRQPAWITFPTLRLRLSEETNVAKVHYVAEGPGWELSGWLVDMGYWCRESGDKELDLYTIGIGNYITENTRPFLNCENIGINVVAALSSGISAGAAQV